MRRLSFNHMVECSPVLDAVFRSLSDPTRRDILRRVATEELTVTEISKSYDLTFAAVSKHLKVLENARLIEKRRQGKVFFVKMVPKPIEEATDFLEEYTKLWNTRFDQLEEYLKTMS
jgi:DNA-binding transcriptional ArsR family regulator